MGEVNAWGNLYDCMENMRFMTVTIKLLAKIIETRKSVRTQLEIIKRALVSKTT